jgi:hypothetical protein
MSITKQDVRDAVHIYHWLKDRCEDLIVDNWLRSRATVHSVHIYKNDDGVEMLNICFDYYCCGETDFDEDNVPMDWLFLSDEELEKARTEERDRRKQIEEEAERQREINEAEKKERKEREMYERLKTKYEN